MAHEFSDACGNDAGEVLLTFCAFLRALALASRRPLSIGSPGRLAVTADERRILILLAAAQAGTPSLFEAHLRWLARAEQSHTLKIAARARDGADGERSSFGAARERSADRLRAKALPRLNNRAAQTPSSPVDVNDPKPGRIEIHRARFPGRH